MSTIAEISSTPGGEPSPNLRTREAKIHLSDRAYAKMILHAAKYPHCAINGVLLSKTNRRSKSSTSGVVEVDDCIPLFHQIEGLTPMIEIALAQIETRCATAGFYICGFYHANRCLRSTSVSVFNQRIADKIAEISNPAVLVTIDSRLLSRDLFEHALIAQMAFEGKWRSCASCNIIVSEDALNVTSRLLQDRIYKELADFDNHLDDVTQDYLNVTVNMEIDKVVRFS